MKKHILIILIILGCFTLLSCRKKDDKEDIIEPNEESRLVLGDERFDEYLPLLKDKRVVLFTNQTGIVGDRIYDRSDNEIIYETVNDPRCPSGKRR